MNDTSIDTATSQFAGNDVTFSITSENADALQVITIKDGLYTRTPLSSLSDITLATNEQMTLVFPKGDEAKIQINGVNMLGVGKQLHWNTSVNGTGTDSAAPDDVVTYSHGDGDSCVHTLAHGEANNTRLFTFEEQLLTDPNGLVVTFTAKEVAYVLLCEDNFAGGSTQEYDYSGEYVEAENIIRSEQLPNASTRFGYEFKGWAFEEDAETADIPAEPEDNRRISNLKAFFNDEENQKYITRIDETTKVRHLYAVWDINDEASYVHIYKSVPEPGNQKTLFTFDVAISGTYKASGQQDQNVSASGSFTLLHGEYAVMHNTCDQEGGWIRSDIEIHNADRTVKTRLEPIIAKAGQQYTNGGFDSTESIRVSERQVAYYDTAVSIPAATTDHPITRDEANRLVSWNSVEAGGTVIFTNTRQTRDITVKKILDSNETTGVFKFSASYTDGTEATNDWVKLDLEDFTLNNGESRVLQVPVGSVLTVTESGTNLVDYTVTASHTTPQTADMIVLETEVTQNNVTTYYRSASLEVTVDDTIIFTNTLIRYPVKFIKTDETGVVKQDESNVVLAFFNLDAETYNIGTSLFSNKGNKGVFYLSDDENEPLYAGHVYTLTETFVDGDYKGLVDPVSITVSGKTGEEFRFRDKNGNEVPDITAEYNQTDELWEIRVRNRKYREITVRKELNDPSVYQREFTFSGGYTLDGKKYGLDRRVFNDKKPYTFTLTPTGGAIAETVLSIPVDATLFYVFEDTSLPVDKASTELVVEVYETTLVFTGQDTATLNETTKTGKSSSGSDIYSPTCKIAKIENDGMVIFTNTVSTGSRRVILRKVKESGDYYASLSGASLTFRARVNGGEVRDVEGNVLGTYQSGGSGVFWIGELKYGTYYLQESSPAEKWFVLTVGDTVEISRPLNTDPRV